jgi:hypothetical protein
MRRQGRRQDRRVAKRRDADFRTRPRRSGREECAAGASVFRDRCGARGALGGCRLHCVGTPSRRGDGHADLSYVYEAAREIARELDGYTVVITKSTVPIGTGDEVERIIREARPDADFSVVSNPEFLREGAAIEDFKHPDRIVIGTTDPRARR